MDTLVLNQSWMPIDHISWERAVTLWFLDKCEIVAEYADRVVRSAGFEMAVPSVIRLLRDVRTRKAARFSRHNVFLRDRGRCCYCGAAVAMKDGSYDHVIPRAQGGRTVWENVVWCCIPCNQRKGGRTPEQARMSLLRHPVKPKSLPNQRPRLPRQIPEDWKAWLQGQIYYHAPLEED